MTDYPQLINCSKFKLRAHRESDKQDIIRAGYDPELFRGIGSPVPQIPINEYANIWLNLKQDPKYSWAIESEGKCVGSAWIHSIEEENRRARFAIEIHDSSFRGKGIGKEATIEVVKVAFEYLKLHRLDLRVLTSNHAAIACYRSCGFKDEGIQRETLFIEDKRESDLWMSILEQEYKEKANKSVDTTRVNARRNSNPPDTLNLNPTFKL